MSRHTPHAAVIAGLCLLGAGALAHAAPSGQTIGFTCLTCHGDKGQGASGIPPLAGRSADALYGMLSEFKSGKRPGTVMNRHATGYSDEELRAVAEYFASQPAK